MMAFTQAIGITAVPRDAPPGPRGKKQTIFNAVSGCPRARPPGAICPGAAGAGLSERLPAWLRYAPQPHRDRQHR
jgi:hypothetical protein